jgi:hypothetical protein
VSKRSEEYVNELTRCPDGFRINCAHKAILGVLSECHSPVKKTIYPSMEYIAEHSCIPLATAKRKMQELEDHLVLERIRPVRQGRGQLTEYVFLEIDDPMRLQQKLKDLGLGDGYETPESEPKKGAQGEPLSNASSEDERGSEGAQKGLKRGSEGAQIGNRYKEEPGTGNREPGNVPQTSLDSDSRLPDGLGASSYAMAVMDSLAMVRDTRYPGREHSIVVNAIETLAREERLSHRDAAEAIVDRGKADRLNGSPINCFWFSDQKFLQPKKSNGAAAAMGITARRPRTPAEKLAEQDGL